MATLRRFLNRPVTLRWVLIPYLGVALMWGYVDHRGDQSDQAIVHTGQAVVHSGCDFDNTRAQALRDILYRSKNQVAEQVIEGATTPEQAQRAYTLLDRDIEDIVIRDCDEAASKLSAH